MFMPCSRSLITVKKELTWTIICIVWLNQKGFQSMPCDFFNTNNCTDWQNIGGLQCITITEAKKCVGLRERKATFSYWNWKILVYTCFWESVTLLTLSSCLNCPQSFRTQNKLESHKKLCENEDFCNIVMSSKDTRNPIKHHSWFMQILNLW